MDDGYTRALVEANVNAIKELKEEMKLQRKEAAERDSRIEQSILELKDELNVYKTVIKVVKLLGATALLILTLKFGDISQLWSN